MKMLPPTMLPGIIDGIIHILLGMVVGVLATGIKFKKIILLSLISEIIIDSSHIVNKAITHNIIFLIEIPLLILLFSCIFHMEKFKRIAIGIQAIFLSHFILDTMIERDTIMLFYPFSTQLYIWNYQQNFFIIPVFLIFYALINRGNIIFKFRYHLRGVNSSILSHG